MEYKSTFTEEEKDGVYSRAIKGVSDLGNKIECNVQINIKAILDTEMKKLLDGGFDFLSYGDFISARLAIKKEEVIKEAISDLEDDFKIRMDYDNDFAKHNL